MCFQYIRHNFSTHHFQHSGIVWSYRRVVRTSISEGGWGSATVTACAALLLTVATAEQWSNERLRKYSSCKLRCEVVNKQFIHSPNFTFDTATMEATELFLTHSRHQISLCWWSDMAHLEQTVTVLYKPTYACLIFRAYRPVPKYCHRVSWIRG
jgi:hypothetical protein